MKIRDSLNQAIREAVKEGKIDRKRQGPLIEAARKVASVMDDPDWPEIGGHIDNVSPSIFLKYCDALGLSVDKKGKSDDKDKVVSLVGNSRWKQAVK